MSAKIFPFTSPVDASYKVARGDPACPGVAMLGLVYDDPAHYRFQLQNADGSLHPAVITVNVAAPDETAAAADIRADLAATLP